VLTDRVLLEVAYAFMLILTATSAAGIILGTIQTVLSVNLLQSTSAGRKSRRKPPRSRPINPGQETGSDSPLVSILKPVSGLEDGLEDNLQSFAQLRGIRYEIIISIADESDPAIEIVKRVLVCFPKGAAHLLVGRGRKVANPKVERLIAAAKVARGDILFVSDSNVRVSPDDIARTVREFEDEEVGCVSNVFIGEGARTLGALLESLYLLIFVLPGNALAAWAGVPCVVGKSMALSRRVYEKLGGFEAFGQLLAEDQSIAVATKKAGYKVVLSPIVVRNIIEKRSVRQVIQRQVRWGKLRYSFSKPLYSIELVLNPVPLIVLACLASKIFSPKYFPALLACAVFTIAHRLCQSLVLMRSSGTRVSKLSVLLVPVQDMIQAAAQVVPYVSKEVNWRGFRTRLGPNSLILAAEQPSLKREYAPAVLSSTWQS
jgi:ceramide glucosyltransferase